MPQRSPADLLDDMVEHIDRATELTSDLTVSVYEADVVLRQAVERSLEIVGEAMRQLDRSEPATTARIADASGIIALRNVLVHRYFDLDQARLLGTIRLRLPNLRSQVRSVRARKAGR